MDDGFLLTGIIIFTIINWILYHKIFNVYYFDFSNGITKELVVCGFFAIIETLIVIAAGEWILGIIGWIFKIAFILLGILIGLLLICVVYSYIKSPQSFKEKWNAILHKDCMKDDGNVGAGSAEEKSEE